MAPQTGDIGALFDIDAVQIPNGDLHVVAANVRGGLYHAVRFNDGSWTPWGDVKAQVGDYGSFMRVGICFDTVNRIFHIVGIANGRLWMTERYADGSWDGGMWDADSDSHVGPFYDADCAYAGSTGHLVALGQPQAPYPASPYPGNLYHRIIYGGELGHVYGDPGSFSSIDATVVGSTLEVSGTRLGDGGDGALWATSRDPSTGVWSSFQKLASPSGPFEDVAGGNLLGELEVVMAAPTAFPYWAAHEWLNTERWSGSWTGWAPLYPSWSVSDFSGAYHRLTYFDRVTASGGYYYY
jgi:hypothetical protein